MPALHVLQGPDKGKRFTIDGDSFVLGRRSVEVPLSDHAISRRHAELRLREGQWIIEDFHSSNGTYINGQRIDGPTVLKHADRVRVGGTLLSFSLNVDEHAAGPIPQADWNNDLVELQSNDKDFDASILASASAGDESVILASPETSDAVHAWNVMYQLAESLGTVASIDELLQRTTDIIISHLPSDRVFVLLRDAESGDMEPAVIRHRRKRANDDDKVITSRRIINHVLQTRQGVLCANAQSETRFGAGSKDASIAQLGLRSVICVPILMHYDVAGVIQIDCPMSIHTYSQQQLLVATAIGKLTGMAIENARLIEARMRQERLAAVGETVAHLSHNIRNILQGIRSGADVVEMGIKRANLDRIDSGWTIVQRNLERTMRLATNMLTFSKQREPQIESAQLNDIVEDAVALCVPPAESKHVNIRTDLDDLPPIPLDNDGIHQVITNIVLNAVEAVDENTGLVLVRTIHDTEHGEVRLTISDNGPGIAEEDRQRIFEAFHSTKGHGGTGLGLAACKKIVDELQGAIEVHSSTEGTSFVVVLDADSHHNEKPENNPVQEELHPHA